MTTDRSQRFHVHSSHTKSVSAGTVVQLSVRDPQHTGDLTKDFTFTWTIQGPFSVPDDSTTLHDQGPRYDFDTAGRRAGLYTITVSRSARGGAPAAPPAPPVATGGAEQPAFKTLATFAGGEEAENDGDRGEPDLTDPNTTPPFELFVTASSPASAMSPDGIVPVSLQRTAIEQTPDQILWTIIRNRTNAIGFRSYKQFVDGVMCQGRDPRSVNGDARLSFTGTQAYEVLKQATNAFLMQESGVVEEGPSRFGQGRLDPRGALASLEDQLDSAAGSDAGEEARRLGRRQALSIDDLRRMRREYFHQLGNEQSVLLPYLQIIRERLGDLPLKGPAETVDNCYGILRSRLTGPLTMELIWSYWHEEGMLVQTLNAILARFQNRRLVRGVDPLARFDLDPLRPLSNLFWGFAEDEAHRLTVRRRAYEYDHEYGLRLLGKAVPEQRTVDSRSRFVESFHTLLHAAHLFFKEDDDTTVIADGFPLLNALRETHLVLAEGAHNQFGDLPSAARAEMLIMQWLLARPEMRDFLGGRVMVPYEEEWEDRVDTMKSMQGWSNVSVTHFRDMGVFGEQLILAVRYGNWSVVNDPHQAANWARYWRPEIQRFVHAYRAATGVDLTTGTDATLPALLLMRRSAQARRNRV